MTYAKLGAGCKSHTIAITDNNKHIQENSEVYEKKYTDIEKPPLSNNYKSFTRQIDSENPEVMRTFYGKYTVPNN